MGVCSQSFTRGLVHEPRLDICHLRWLGATYFIYFYFLTQSANDSQLIWKFARHSNAYSKHLSLEFLFGHVLMGVNPFGRCTFVTPLPQLLDK
jgi:threonine/homoserine/homoserine lactone efflux protein